MSLFGSLHFNNSQSTFAHGLDRMMNIILPPLKIKINEFLPGKWKERKMVWNWLQENQGENVLSNVNLIVIGVPQLTRHIKKKVHSYFYILLAKKKSLDINANHSLFKKSQLKCFFFPSDQEVISKVDKTISRKVNLHTLSSIIVFHHLFSIILRLLKFIWRMLSHGIIRLKQRITLQQ